MSKATLVSWLRGAARSLRETRANMLGTADETHYWQCHDAAGWIDQAVVAIDCLEELLRLYDWRNELGAIERDPNHDKKAMSRNLNRYGREKKAAWVHARAVLAGTKGHGE